ncbi:MAG: hypothetical protein NT076_02290 [Candidatus Pacearchaeota archaeon]|nr:hypothetical protein [Candidatus Pacearchaeota archaeon]
MKKGLSRKSQVTLFIIAGVVLVALVALLFLFKGKNIVEIFNPSAASPESYIEKCVKDAASNGIDIMLGQGGYIDPKNFKLYQDKKVQYLCYTNKYYYPCVNQEPLYIERLDNEIKNYIKDKVEDCFYSLKQDYESKNYVVSLGASDLQVNLMPKQVEITIDKKVEISKNEQIENFDKFKVKFNNPLYDLAMVAIEAVNQEARFCYFEYTGYMMLYPSVEIEKKAVGEAETSSKIYTIMDRITSKKLYIAIRSCAFPPGL